ERFPGLKVLYIRQRQRPHRFVVGRLLSISFKHPVDLALAGRHDYQVVVLAVLVHVRRPGVLDHQVSAPLGELVHPPRELHTLIDGLPVVLEFRLPKKSLCLVGAWNSKRDALRRRALFLPEINAEVALGLKGIMEHELTGGYPSVENLVCGAIAYD